MADARLQKEFEYYLAHQTELAAKYQGRYIVIKGGEVLGHYASPEEAVRATAQSTNQAHSWCNTATRTPKAPGSHSTHG